MITYFCKKVNIFFTLFIWDIIVQKSFLPSKMTQKTAPPCDVNTKQCSWFLSALCHFAELLNVGFYRRLALRCPARLPVPDAHIHYHGRIEHRRQRLCAAADFQKRQKTPRIFHGAFLTNLSPLENQVTDCALAADNAHFLWRFFVQISLLLFAERQL